MVERVASQERAGGAVRAGSRVVRVLPDVPAIDKEFDYLVPPGTEVAVGDVVRVQLHGRRVGAWIVAVDVEPEPGVQLKPLAKVSSPALPNSSSAARSTARAALALAATLARRVSVSSG